MCKLTVTIDRSHPYITSVTCTYDVLDCFQGARDCESKTPIYGNEMLGTMSKLLHFRIPGKLGSRLRRSRQVMVILA